MDNYKVCVCLSEFHLGEASGETMDSYMVCVFVLVYVCLSVLIYVCLSVLIYVYLSVLMYVHSSVLMCVCLSVWGDLGQYVDAVCVYERVLVYSFTFLSEL